VHDLEAQLAESKRLLEMKNADLARLQAQLAAKQAAEAAAASTPARPATPESQPQAGAPPPSAAAPPPSATVPAPPAPEATPAAPSETQPVPPPAQPAPPAAREKVVAPSGGGSLVQTLRGYWWAVLLVLAVLALLVIARTVRARRAAEFDDSLGRLAVAGAASAEPEAREPRLRATEAPPPIRPQPAAMPETTFLVEESGTHERPALGQAAAPAPAARHVASDETISSETAINLDQGDPLAEADFHMAYGLYDQAADLIRIAIAREPNRRDLKLKLLEVFFVWGNKEQFLQTANELASTRAEAPPGEWEKILIMGKQLAPDDALFSGAGGVSGVTAGGVDLDLEGGQSRVDFDLLGEPVAGEAPGGVDLDIGAAVGDVDSTVESTTNVTDQNEALIGSTFLSTTGATREMTARIEKESETGTETEGPTVEQPAIGGDNRTVRQKVESALRQGGVDRTEELAIDDLGLDVGGADTVDQPGPEQGAPTMVADLDDAARKAIEDSQTRVTMETPAASSTGAWQFDQTELETALLQTGGEDPSATARLTELSARPVDVDATSSHPAVGGGVDIDVGAATGQHPGKAGLDLDVGPETGTSETPFSATQTLSAEELALPDLEPVTMSEVGTKLDLARAYMDMGDPDGARNILAEVLNEGSAAQKQEAQRLMESLPG
ncbi:MAG: hypothetical protein JO361_05030, partial [Gammaproteobacteria bacterium]|nr:hypothetical protein [Gammaproteobacteria bacterium]